MSTHVYDVAIQRRGTDPFGRPTLEVLAHFKGAPAWEVSPVLKKLVKHIHESPPVQVLPGQESML